MKRGLIIALACVLALVGVITACAPEEGPPTEGPPTEGPPTEGPPTEGPPTEEEPVKIAGVFPLTGFYSSEAIYQKEAFLLAIDEQNEAGGIKGRPIEAIVRDTELKAEVAIRRTEELVADGCVGVIGTLHGGIQQSVNAWCKERHIPFATGTPLCAPINNKENIGPGTFGAFDLSQPPRMLADMVMEQEGWNTFYIIYPDYQYGYVQRDQFILGVERNGGEILGQDAATPGLIEFGPLISKALASGADALYVPCFGADQVNALKNAEAYGVKEKMGVCLTMTELTIVKAAGPDACEEVYFCTPWYWEIDLPEAKTFTDKISARHGHPAGCYSFYTYIETQLLLRGLDGAASFSAEDVRDYLFANTTQELPTGTTDLVDYLHAFKLNFYMQQGKAPADVSGEWDLLNVVDSRTPDPKYLPTPEELGY